MGIQGYFRWLTSKYPQAITNVNERSEPEPFDYVYFDINNILYACARKSNSEGRLFYYLFSFLDTVLKKFTPHAGIYLAVDGSGKKYLFLLPSWLISVLAPRAKVLTQRNRRFSSENNSNSVIDTLQFTPGNCVCVCVCHCIGGAVGCCVFYSFLLLSYGG